MADISNRKYYSYITDTEAPESFPPSSEVPQNPVNPPSQGGSSGTLSGTTNQIAKFTSPLNVGDSKASEDGTTFYMEDLELRLGTLDNLGTTPTNVLVPSGTGVVKIRTLTQFKNDLGVISIPLPDGVVTQGDATQTGNDIEYDTAWVWRISSTEYQLPSDDTITFPSAASGKIRIDLVVATDSNTIYRVAGTEVNDTETAVAPSLPSDTVALQQVFISDTGIDSFEDFAVATFVRFDINDQDLSAVQRQNARTNIQALSLDTDEERVGNLFNDGFVRVYYPDGPIYSDGPESAFKVYGLSASNLSRAMITCISGNQGAQSVVFRVRNRGDVKIDHYSTGSIWEGFSIYRNGTARLIHGTGNSIVDISDSFKFWARVTAENRSSISPELTRRDELYMNYYENNGDSGPLHDLVIDDSTKLLRVGIATELTGVNPNGDVGRLLRIEADSVTLTVKDEDSNSSANNRFDLGSDLVISSGEVYTFIYTNNRWRRCQ